MLKKTKPLISIVMNCYNGDAFLKEALDSIVVQSYENWEIIFWDNQSLDKSAEIFKSYKDNRFKYFYAKSHEILFKARSQAIEKIKGEYVSFLDVDDLWEKDKLKKQISLFLDPDVGVVYGNYWVLNYKKKNTEYIQYKKKLSVGNVKDKILKDYNIGMLTIIIRVSFLRKLENIFDSRFQIIGDFDLMVRLSSICNFECVQEPIAYYRWHGSNISLTQKNKGLDELLLWANEVKSNRPFYYHENINYVFEKINYEKAKYNIEEGSRFKSIQYFNKIKTLSTKLKIIIIFLIPTFLYKKLKF